MAASLNDRVQPATRTWAPRTADLDNLSTSDIREDNTLDLAAIRTHDVDGPQPREEPATPHTFTPLVQPVAELTSDLDSKGRPAGLSAHQLAPRSEPPRRARAAAAATEGVASAQPPRSARETNERPALTGISPGAVLNDRYLIERALGAGGTAWVFRARDLTVQKDAPGAHIAIKTPRPDVKDPARAIARLQHEFRHVQALRHPNIARVLALNSDDQTWFMTMELIEGRSLAQLIREPASLSLPLKRAVLTSCAKALAHAHTSGVVHGDFKPSNVLVSSSGQVKVFDFGAATSPGGEDTRIPAGTPAYASPQVLSGATPDPRDDVFSFACVAYEFLTGQHPFERRSSLDAREQRKAPPRTSLLSLPQWLALLSALAWEREQRPSDIEHFATMLMDDAASLASAQTDPASEAPSDSPVVEPRAAAPETSDELAPPQRSWGFFAFLACALGLMFIGSQRQTEQKAETEIADGPAVSEGEFPIAPAGLMGAPATDRSNGEGNLSGAALGLGTSEGGLPISSADERPREAPVERAPSEKQTQGPASEISFESASVATSESSLAAVFVIKRSESLSRRIQIRWKATSGTAEAGVDFASDAMGTVEFLEGQTQRAIYVPLRNDVLKEGDETFSLELEVVRGGGHLASSTAQATILDDD